VLVDLVQTTTRDGLRLDGAFQSPDGSPAVPIDAFCFIHGTGGNFYSSSLFDDLGAHLLQLGCRVLRVNTRGHDGISSAQTDRGGRRQGAAYEVVADCRHDIAAWVGWLRQHGCGRVGLVGHSLGAVKAVYALAQEPQLDAACLLALSPPRLSYSVFCASSQGKAFLDTYHQAEEHVANGRPTALMDVQLPLPFVVTAAGYVEKYGPDEPYNFLRLLPGVRCPTLVTFGSREVETNMAFQGLPEEIGRLAVKRLSLTVRTIAGGDHFYTGVRDEILGLVANWLRSLNLLTGS
jgi:pimeloyl-ACP methyl ester carboxylesterase